MSDSGSSSTNLIWIDLEMTGLDPVRNRIIEIATIVTDTHLNEIAEGPVLAIQQTSAVLEGMDEWNTRHHSNSGLLDRVLASTVDALEAERQTVEFLREYVTAGTSPMCGNSICQDRRFMARYMPDLETFFHYRNLDVSTLKILAQRWAPELATGVQKKSAHLALSDIRDSIAELVYYREHFLALPATSGSE